MQGLTIYFLVCSASSWASSQSMHGLRERTWRTGSRAGLEQPLGELGGSLSARCSKPVTQLSGLPSSSLQQSCHTAVRAPLTCAHRFSSIHLSCTHLQDYHPCPCPASGPTKEFSLSVSRVSVANILLPGQTRSVVKVRPQARRTLRACSQCAAADARLRHHR